MLFTHAECIIYHFASHNIIVLDDTEINLLGQNITNTAVAYCKLYCWMQHAYNMTGTHLLVYYTDDNARVQLLWCHVTQGSLGVSKLHTTENTVKSLLLDFVKKAKTKQNKTLNFVNTMESWFLVPSIKVLFWPLISHTPNF